MAEKKYTQSVTSTGGGRDGRITGDGQMNMDLRPLDAKEDGTNPEALLAAAWAACFNGALQKTMKEEGVDVDAHTPSVTAHVSFYTLDDGGLQLGAVLEASSRTSPASTTSRGCCARRTTSAPCPRPTAATSSS